MAPVVPLNTTLVGGEAYVRVVDVAAWLRDISTWMRSTPIVVTFDPAAFFGAASTVLTETAIHLEQGQ